MAPPVIALRSVVAMLDRFPVLAGVDLDVDAGEVVLLRGPNGAGKTSLLRVVAGLLETSRGEARVLGVDIVRDRRSMRRHTGFLPHESFLYPELSAVENVQFAVRALHLDLDRVRPAVERMEMGGRLADVPVGLLSAGQRRRVAIACLIARDPALWLLDEPHSGLDDRARQVLDEIVDDAARRGSTVLFTSHEIELSSTAADRQIYLDNGVVTSDRSSGSKVGATSVS